MPEEAYNRSPIYEAIDPPLGGYDETQGVLPFRRKGEIVATRALVAGDFSPEVQAMLLGGRTWAVQLRQPEIRVSSLVLQWCMQGDVSALAALGLEDPQGVVKALLDHLSASAAALPPANLDADAGLDALMFQSLAEARLNGDKICEVRHVAKTLSNALGAGRLEGALETILLTRWRRALEQRALAHVLDALRTEMSQLPSRLQTEARETADQACERVVGQVHSALADVRAEQLVIKEMLERLEERTRPASAKGFELKWPRINWMGLIPRGTLARPTSNLN